MNDFKNFMISRVRVSIFELFFQNPEEMYYVRQISRKINEEINAVRRELDRMSEYKLLKSEKRSNRLYYYLNTNYIFFEEMQQMVAKTTGLGKVIRKNKRKLGSVKYVMFSGRFVEGKAARQDQVDALLIGDVDVSKLQKIIQEHQENVDREINYAVFSEEEFEFRKTRRDPFVMEILYGTKVMIIGNEVEFSTRQTPDM